MTSPQIFYRYVYETTLKVKKYNLIKETPGGYWIDVNYYNFPKKKKWISKTSRKRWAYPTEKEALNNYILRSKSRIRYLINDTKYTAEGVEAAEKKMKTL